MHAEIQAGDNPQGTEQIAAISATAGEHANIMDMYDSRESSVEINSDDDSVSELANLGTRQFIDKTTHRHGFWRQFIDTIEDYSSTLFEDNSSTHYYLAIIPKLIK